MRDVNSLPGLHKLRTMFSVKEALYSENPELNLFRFVYAQ